MDQTAVKPLSRGPANSTVLIGWVWVWGWVSTGYGVARCSESVESRRGVGQLDLLVSWGGGGGWGGGDPESGGAARSLECVDILIADKACSRATYFLHIPTAVKCRYPLISQWCGILRLLLTWRIKLELSLLHTKVTRGRSPTGASSCSSCSTGGCTGAWCRGGGCRCSSHSSSNCARVGGRRVHLAEL